MMYILFFEWKKSYIIIITIIYLFILIKKNLQNTVDNNILAFNSSLFSVQLSQPWLPIRAPPPPTVSSGYDIQGCKMPSHPCTHRYLYPAQDSFNKNQILKKLSEEWLVRWRKPYPFSLTEAEHPTWMRNYSRIIHRELHTSRETPIEIIDWTINNMYSIGNYITCTYC